MATGFIGYEYSTAATGVFEFPVVSFQMPADPVKHISPSHCISHDVDCREQRCVRCGMSLMEIRCQERGII